MIVESKFPPRLGHCRSPGQFHLVSDATSTAIFEAPAARNRIPRCRLARWFAL